ncbi:MAG: winged helix-turn-helix transcriptional regulator [Proteobacteria bacterium]|nr:winged helix-turn-helix transcriptional regulator [Pseudomonadota bacterium]
MTRRPSADVTRAWARLARAQRVVLDAIERDLKAAGCPPLAWYDVLLELSRAPQGRLRPFEIEKETLLAQYNLSRLIDRLAGERLVARMTCEADGRGQWVVISDAGRAMQARMWKVYAGAIQAHVGARLDDKDARTLADLLGRLIGAGASAKPAPGHGERT